MALPAAALPASAFSNDGGPGTVVGRGTIAGETWTLAGSPYHVTGDIGIVGLVIEPGVCVQADPNVPIDILTTIDAEGTATQPIVFEAFEDNPLDRWRGLLFLSPPAGCVLRHCTVRESKEGGIRVSDGTALVIADCLIENNTTNGYGGGFSANMITGSAELVGCRITGNTSGLDGGGVWASLGNGDLSLTDCSLEENQAGPGGEGGGLWASLLDGDAHVNDCSVEGNTSNFSGGGIYLTAPTGTLFMSSTPSATTPSVRTSRAGRRVEAWRCKAPSGPSAAPG